MKTFSPFLVLGFCLCLQALKAAEPIFKPTGIYAVPEAPVVPTKPKPAKPNLSKAVPWYETNMFGQNIQTTPGHLTQTHHADPEIVKLLTPEELNRYHGTFHQSAKVQRSSSPCPGGVCPLPSRRRGIFSY